MDDREASCSSTSSKRYEERLGLSDQSSIRWLATHGKELTMVQKDVLRGWHGTCMKETGTNWSKTKRTEEAHAGFDRTSGITAWSQEAIHPRWFHTHRN